MFSFVQTYPLRKGVGAKLKSFFYKGEREIEFTCCFVCCFDARAQFAFIALIYHNKRKKVNMGNRHTSAGYPNILNK